jgi:Fe2+ or Zn2+ uptake regulation protein
MNIISKIRNTELKVTKHNVALLELLKKNHDPLSATQIWIRLNKKINLVSIYRILARLEKANLIKNDVIKNERVYYLSSSHHHHIICKSCQKIFCLPCKIKIDLPKNFTLLTHKIELEGLCNKCTFIKK